VHHDLVILEGYKNHNHPKIAVYRYGVIDPGYIKALANCVAIATDDPGFQTVLGPSPPLLALNEPLVVSRFIRHHLALADLVSV